jgi:hypothetical protein
MLSDSSTFGIFFEALGIEASNGARIIFGALLIRFFVILKQAFFKEFRPSPVKVILSR